MLLASWFLRHFFKRFRSFHTINIGSVGQRVAKSPAFKVGGIEKKSATLPKSNHMRAVRVWLWPGPNHSQSLTNGNFAVLWPTDFILTELKDLNLLKNFIKNQEAGSILTVCFALLKWHHFHRVYLVRLPFLTGIAVVILREKNLS